MKILGQQWLYDASEDSYGFQLSARKGFDVKATRVAVGASAYENKETRQMAEETAYGKLREAFGDAAEAR